MARFRFIPHFYTITEFFKILDIKKVKLMSEMKNQYGADAGSML